MKPALREARNILKSIQKQDHRDIDIEARTALSRARQTLKVVKKVERLIHVQDKQRNYLNFFKILFGKEEAEKMKQQLWNSEKKVNDLLQHIDSALMKIREVYKFIHFLQH